MKDFSLEMYKLLCESALQNDFHICTVANYLINSPNHPKLIIFRHDVDRNPQQALLVAELEAALGIQSTFYFRAKKSVFKKNIITKIQNLGHEIGYHYETLAQCHGDYEKAIELFQSELEDFREICTISTISMHGRPLSPHDNRDLWKKYDFHDFNLIGECYLSIDYGSIHYLSDTGRSWHNTRYNLRDIVNGDATIHVETTPELIAYLRSVTDGHHCILTHPNRWTDSPVLWTYERAYDFLANQVKYILKKFRD